MELEDMIKQYLEQQLAKEAAPVAEPEQVQKADPKYVTEESLKTILEGFAGEVAKALPVEREAGTGRKGVQGVEKNAPGAATDPFEELVSKARANPDKLEADEKEALWRLTYEYLTAGLRA